MDEETRKRLEYEEQFFGITSRFFADSFRNFLKDELEEKISILVNDFKRKIFNQAKNPEQFELAIREMKQSLAKEYSNSIDVLFPGIESKIPEFMNIPANILLKEDLPVKLGINGNISEVKEEIENLKGTLKSLLYLKKEMMEELDEADTAINYMNNIIREKKLDLEVLTVDEILYSKENLYLLHENVK